VTVLKPKTAGFEAEPNRTKLKPQFSGGYVTVFLKFQKWSSPITSLHNNVTTGHAGLLPPPSEVSSDSLEWSGPTT